MLIFARMELYHCTISTPIGLMEISGSKHAIHAIRFVLQKQVDSPQLPALLNKCRQELEEYFEGKRKAFSIHTEQSGTDFQKLIWRKLEDIPFGKTISYLDLARLAGDEKSTRAVGSANGRNRIPVIIPCHRVIGSDDSLTGYAGGLWRKQWLLDHEKKFAYGIQKLF